MTAVLDTREIDLARKRHLLIGIRLPREPDPVEEPARAPDLQQCWYLPDLEAFVVKYAGGLRTSLPLHVLDLPEHAHVIGCEVDEFRRGVSVALDDGTVTSFSGDFVLYRTDPDFKRRVDERAHERRRTAAPGVTFGQRVREAREALGLSLVELGSRVGMAAPNVHRIETAKHAPTTKTVLAMAAALGRTLAWLLAGESQTSREAAKSL